MLAISNWFCFDLRKHHKRASLLVLKLLGTIPLSPDPSFIKEKLEEIVCDSGRRESPRSIIARAVLVTPTESMSTRECDNLLVVEAHTVEDLTEASLVRINSKL